jgi:N-acetylglucosamine kinase-like BadF-type ATPase
MTEQRLRLYADSGSSKTDWVICRPEGHCEYFTSAGLNPWFVGVEGLKAVLETEVLQRLDQGCDAEVFFYGAGLGNAGFREQYSKLFVEKGFKKVVVDTDLCGAGKAAPDGGEGLVMILGTGANAGLFREGMLVATPPSMGFILGDEGSAAWIGKELLIRYMRGNLPAPMLAELSDFLGCTHAEILDRVYRQPRPNYFVASVAAVVQKFSDEAVVAEILDRGFRAFFEHYIVCLAKPGDDSLTATGSVALAHQERLRNIAASYGINKFSVLYKPIEGLCRNNRW